MTLTRKKQVLYASLIAFSVWPLAHLELVRRFGISPWKLAGWGMYATPRIAPGVGILVREQGEETSAPIKVVSPEIRAATEDYQTVRLWLRRLAPPDELGRMILASNPNYERATVLLIELVVDVKTGMVRTEESSYDYERNVSNGVQRKS